VKRKVTVQVVMPMDSVITAAVIAAIGSVLAAAILVLPSLRKKRRSTSITTSALRFGRKEYNDHVIRAIESNPMRLRAIIVGSHFLHPRWLMERRVKRERRKSFSQALRNYLENSAREGGHDVRLILRNSNRYYQVLKPDVKNSEVDGLVKEMKFTLHELFSDEPLNPTISFRCKDPGYYYGVLITDSSCFVYSSNSGDSRIEFGEEHKEPAFIANELTRFDQVFDAGFRSQAVEIRILEGFIDSLPSSLTSDPPTD
jgi:hypothetical protein